MIVDCLQDLPQIQISRKTFLQVIMREMNQYLYREVNTLQVSNYVDIDRYSWSKDGSVTTTTTVTNRTTDSYLVDNGSSQVKSFAFSRRFIVLTLRRRFGDLTSFDLFSIQYLNRNTKYVPDDWLAVQLCLVISKILAWRWTGRSWGGTCSGVASEEPDPVDGPRWLIHLFEPVLLANTRIRGLRAHL